MIHVIPACVITSQTILISVVTRELPFYPLFYDYNFFLLSYKKVIFGHVSESNLLPFLEVKYSPTHFGVDISICKSFTCHFMVGNLRIVCAETMFVQCNAVLD